MSVRNILYENVVLPVSDLVTGQHVSASLRFLKKSESWTRQQIDDYQNDRLRKLIKHAVTTVPYYRDLFKQLGLTPDDIQTKEDLRKIPIVDKTIMRKEGIERFTSESFPSKEMRLDRSSGSTGEPFNSYTTKDAYSFNLAAKLHTWYKNGYRLGDKYVKLSQRLRKSRLKKWQDIFNRCLYIPVEDASDERLYKAMLMIERYKPNVIRGYPSTILFLAQCRQQHPEFTHNPKWIATTGEQLTRKTRCYIESTFCCKIIDSYSCEGNSNVSECAGNNCYHVTEEYGITEILDDNGEPVKDGVGHVVTTDLWNYAHPFIRYNTQDLVEVSSERCNCGSQHMRINSIVGRSSENIIAVNGCRYTTQTLSIFFTDSNSPLGKSVDGYQLVQKKDGTMVFKLVVNDFFDDVQKKYIVNYWESLFGKPIEIELVEKLPLTKNNKWLSIVFE